MGGGKDRDLKLLAQSDTASLWQSQAQNPRLVPPSLGNQPKSNKANNNNMDQRILLHTTHDQKTLVSS